MKAEEVVGPCRRDGCEEPGVEVIVTVNGDGWLIDRCHEHAVEACLWPPPVKRHEGGTPA